MAAKEALARIKINKLLEEAGWRFFDDGNGPANVVHHYMSPKHLHRYVNEFSFRQNTREAGTMGFINMRIGRMDGKRLTYKELINAA